MKIGLDFGKCLIDVYTSEVQEIEVLVILSNEYFNPHKSRQWDQLWEHNTVSGLFKPVWHAYSKDYNEIRKLATRLYDTGKIHQPKTFNVLNKVPNIKYHWLDCAIPVEELEKLPAVKKAWEHYQILAGLCQ